MTVILYIQRSISYKIIQYTTHKSIIRVDLQNIQNDATDCITIYLYV